MAGEWSTAALEELVDDILDRRGVTPLKLGSDFTSAGHRVISAKLMKESRLDLSADEPRFVDAPTYKKWMQSPLLADDVILTSEAPLGEIAYIKEKLDWCLGQRLFGIRTNKSKLFGRFLFYALKSEPVFNDLTSRATGTTVQGIRQSELRRVQIPVPPLAKQKAIATVLGALDDKIELNRQMNATLEAMAQALFKSWFVEFDPVRAKLDGRKPEGFNEDTAALFPDCFQDSALGENPNGWRLGTLGELVQLRTDRVEATPAKDGMRYIALEDMPSKSIDLSNYQLGSAVNSSITAFRRGDILFGSMRPYFHKVGLAFFDGITRTTTFVLRPRKDCFRHFALLHFFSNDVIAHSTTASVGTTIPYVRWDSMESYCVPIPPDSLLEVFEKAVSPLFQRIAIQGEESRTLATLRDTLLPKLLSGELGVDKIKEGLVA